jgi:hypothetical protein
VLVDLSAFWSKKVRDPGGDLLAYPGADLASLAHAALEHGVDVQLPAEVADVQPLVMEMHRRRARRRAGLIDRRQQIPFIVNVLPNQEECRRGASFPDSRFPLLVLPIWR